MMNVTARDILRSDEGQFRSWWAIILVLVAGALIHTLGMMLFIHTLWSRSHAERIEFWKGAEAVSQEIRVNIAEAKASLAELELRTYKIEQAETPEGETK